MNLYIETENNQPINHPAFEENLLQAFGTIPEQWKPFIRVEAPTLLGYQIYEGVTYELIEGVYTDVHHVSEMTEEEKSIKRDLTIAQWGNHYPSWVFNESVCAFEPPVLYPQDNKQYYWNEQILNWVEVA
jgi:hypothetical protein